MNPNSFEAFLDRSVHEGTIFESWGSTLLQKTEKKEPPPTLYSSQLTTSKIYGSKSFGPVLTQWQPIVSLRTPSPEPPPDLSKIEKHIFKYLNRDDFDVLSRVCHGHRNFFWRHLLVSSLKESPLFRIKNSFLSAAVHPEIEITKHLRQISPKDMGNNTFMQGEIQLAHEHIRYYLMQCETDGVPSIIVLFKYHDDVFVFDTANRAIRSSTPDTPLRFEHVQFFFKDLILKKQHHAAEAISEDDSVSLAFVETKVKLYKKMAFTLESTAALNQAPIFNGAHLNPIHIPYIPLNYHEPRISLDKKENIPLQALAITAELSRIKPEEMVSHTFMQGSIRFSTPDKAPIPYYLIRCVTKAHLESVIVLFRINHEIFAFDTANSIIHSHHPLSPVAFNKVKPDIEQLLEGHLSDASLWKSDRREWIAPALHVGHMNVRYDMIMLRTSLAAFSVFLLSQLTPLGSYSIGALTAVAGMSCLGYEKYSAHKTLREVSIRHYMSHSTPSAKAMQIIASSYTAIDSLKEHDLNKVSDEGRSLLCYCTKKHLRELLIQYGASPLLNQHNFPLLEAVARGDRAASQQYLQANVKPAPSQEMQLFRSASKECFDLLKGFNIDAKDDLSGKTALEALFHQVCRKAIRTKDDLEEVHRLVNRAARLIQAGANPQPVLKMIDIMKALRDGIEIETDLSRDNAHALFDLWEPLELLISRSKVKKYS